MHRRCKTITLACPAEFIPFNAPSSLLEKQHRDYITIDECLEEEIQYLWLMGVKTAGCCCGHCEYDGFINVFDESIPLMHQLGYELWDWTKMYPDESTRPDFAYNRQDTFKTKNKCKGEKCA